MTSDTVRIDPSAARAPVDARTLLTRMVEGRGASPARVAPFPTGFTPLDQVLGGGLRAQELTLLGGRPGVGKTVAALQWARAFAMQGRTSVYICYEHSPETLLGRLFALEMGTLVRADEFTMLDDLRALARDVALGSGQVDDLLRDPLGEEVVGRVQSYGDRLHIVAASGKSTGAAEIEAIASRYVDGPTAVVVDYLQKVAVRDRAADEEERSTIVVEHLKDLAMALDVAVLAIVASDRSGITSRRLRLDHFRGSAALAHECDVALVLNEKLAAVSKRHTAYDPVRAETFRRQVVLSVEKNRGGPTGMDMQYTKDFANYRFEPDGTFVAERLVDDLVDSE